MIEDLLENQNIFTFGVFFFHKSRLDFTHNVGSKNNLFLPFISLSLSIYISVHRCLIILTHLLLVFVKFTLFYWMWTCVYSFCCVMNVTMHGTLGACDLSFGLYPMMTGFVPSVFMESSSRLLNYYLITKEVISDFSSFLFRIF